MAFISSALGIVDAEPRHVALEPALVEVQAQPRGRHEHVDAARPEPEVAGQRHVGRAAVHAALQHGHRHRPAVLERVDDLVEGHGTRGADARDVIAAAEVLAASLQGQHQHLGHGVDGGDVRRQHREVVRFEAVGLPGPLQRDAGDLAVDLEFGGSHVTGP
jgi:hypothetical protein